MPEVQVTRVPQPAVRGTPYQKTIVYQINNLNAALSLIKEDDVFRTTGHFIAATGRALRDSREELTVGSVFFVCPVLNTIVRQGLKVIALEARNVRSVSKLLHAA